MQITSFFICILPNINIIYYAQEFFLPHYLQILTLKIIHLTRILPTLILCVLFIPIGHRVQGRLSHLPISTSGLQEELQQQGYFNKTTASCLFNWASHKLPIAKNPVIAFMKLHCSLILAIFRPMMPLSLTQIANTDTIPQIQGMFLLAEQYHCNWD